MQCSTHDTPTINEPGFLGDADTVREAQRLPRAIDYSPDPALWRAIAAECGAGEIDSFLHGAGAVMVPRKRCSPRLYLYWPVWAMELDCGPYTDAQAMYFNVKPFARQLINAASFSVVRTRVSCVDEQPVATQTLFLFDIKYNTQFNRLANTHGASFAKTAPFIMFETRTEDANTGTTTKLGQQFTGRAVVEGPASAKMKYRIGGTKRQVEGFLKEMGKQRVRDRLARDEGIERRFVQRPNPRGENPDDGMMIVDAALYPKEVARLMDQVEGDQVTFIAVVNVTSSPNHIANRRATLRFARETPLLRILQVAADLQREGHETCCTGGVLRVVFNPTALKEATNRVGVAATSRIGMTFITELKNKFLKRGTTQQIIERIFTDMELAREESRFFDRQAALTMSKRRATSESDEGSQGDVVPVAVAKEETEEVLDGAIALTASVPLTKEMLAKCGEVAAKSYPTTQLRVLVSEATNTIVIQAEPRPPEQRTGPHPSTPFWHADSYVEIAAIKFYLTTKVMVPRRGAGQGTGRGNAPPAGGGARTSA
jgi:hypothetical protein